MEQLPPIPWPNYLELLTLGYLFSGSISGYLLGRIKLKKIGIPLTCISWVVLTFIYIKL